MTPEGVFHHLQRLRNRADVRPFKSDRDLNPNWPLPARLRPAAVLVGLVRRETSLAVLLTQREVHLSEHAGQISFPGGRVDPCDESVTAAALREAREEVGLASHLVTPSGWLDTYVTMSGYQIAPLVGIVAPPPCWQPNVGEVARVFELPITELLAPQAFAVRAFALPSGEIRRTHILRHGEYDIWGATASILVNLREVLLNED